MTGLDAHRRMAACILASAEHELNHTETLVLQVFAFHAKQQSLRGFAAVSRLEALTGKSKPSIKRAIKRLVELGLLRQVQAPTGRKAARFVVFADTDRDQIEDLVHSVKHDDEDGSGFMDEPHTERRGFTSDPSPETVEGSSNSVEGSSAPRRGVIHDPRTERTERTIPPLPPEGGGCSASESKWKRRGGTPESRAMAFRLKAAGLKSRVPMLAQRFVEDGGTEDDLRRLVEKAHRDGKGLGLLHDWLSKGASKGAHVWRDVLLDGDERQRHERGKREHARAALDAQDPICGAVVTQTQPTSVADLVAFPTPPTESDDPSARSMCGEPQEGPGPGQLIGPQGLKWADGHTPPEELKEAAGQ